ncbi:MAG: TIGR03905 family TSCPD domain-containing protein [Ruminococcus sp.]|nr:TIGR03905 family TSCPD domain-containing protein [Ruminococcus sp.]
MKFTYKTQDTCSSVITFDYDNGVVTNVVFTGGCNGNLKAIPRLIDGWTPEQISEKCKGVTCGRRPTSCADQLAKAVMEAAGNPPVNSR